MRGRVARALRRVIGVRLAVSARIGLLAVTLAALAASGAPRPFNGQRQIGPPPGGPTAADPVSISTGIYYRHTLDLIVWDVVPIRFGRVYQSNETGTRAFGVSTGHSYDYELTGSLAAITIVTPEGSRVHYRRVDGGTGREGARYEHWTTRSRYWGSAMGWMGDRWGVTFSDGAGLIFRSCGTREAPNGRCTLVGVADGADNQLALTRDEHGLLLRIETPNRRWVRLQYDPAGRVSRASDSSGAHVVYEYNDAGRLARVIRSDGRIDTYEYDARGLMTRMKDVPGMVVENEYDSDGRPVRQIVSYEADERGAAPPPAIWQFSYVVSDGRVRHGEVVRPRGERNTLTFDAQGYTNREVWQYPGGRSTTIDYIVDTAEHRVTSVLVSCIGSDGATKPLSARIAPRMSAWTMARLLSAQCGVPVLEVDDER